MSLRAILPALLLPPVGFALLTLCGCVVMAWRRRLGCMLVVGGALGILLMATPYADAQLRHSLERGLGGIRSDVAPAAIVVLGAETVLGPSGAEIGPLTLERLRAGAALERRTGLPLLVTGGVLAFGQPPVARLMARSLLEDFQTPAHWIEEEAATTHENATRSTAMLRAAGIGGVFIVTHGWHMKRALDEFTAAGMAATPAPVRLVPAPAATIAAFVPRADHLAGSWWSIREWAGRAALSAGL